MTVLGFVLYGSMVLLPIFLQTLLGYPALAGGHRHGAARAGLVPRHAAWSGVIMARFDPRKLLALGLLGGVVHPVPALAG